MTEPRGSRIAAPLWWAKHLFHSQDRRWDECENWDDHPCVACAAATIREAMAEAYRGGIEAGAEDRARYDRIHAEVMAAMMRKSTLPESLREKAAT